MKSSWKSPMFLTLSALTFTAGLTFPVIELHKYADSGPVLHTNEYLDKIAGQDEEKLTER